MSRSVYKNMLVEIIHFSTNVLKLKDKWFYLLFKVTSESALRNLFFLRKGTLLMYLPPDRKVKEIAYLDKAFLQALVLIKTQDFRRNIDSVVLCDLTTPRRTNNVLFFWVDIGELKMTSIVLWLCTTGTYSSSEFFITESILCPIAKLQRVVQ